MKQFKSEMPKDCLVYDKAKFVFVPVPFEKTTSYGKGTKHGPDAILEASSQIEYFDEELQQETCSIAGVHTVKSVTDLAELEKVTEKILIDSKIPIALGGEHSISAAPIRACKKIYPDLSVVHFDAHGDLRDSYEGTPLSHASVMHRVYDAGVNFVQIGIRSQCKEEFDFIAEKKLNKPYYAFEIHNSVSWIDDVISKLNKNVYFTFDVDAFDPSIMPATGTPEPGGLTWYQVTAFMKKLAATRNIVGADFVELAPMKGWHTCDFMIAKLIYKFMGYIVANSKT